uniref:Uncharacterized protein n=1 Tax=uncultured Thiotrichaceae bacterium TaxID=298394 RepID=A0A6S6TU30_9GAMM|nr:MAG: Unknown protein [uncultured Thiotrichaceae bacterium]
MIRSNTKHIGIDITDAEYELLVALTEGEDLGNVIRKGIDHYTGISWSVGRGLPRLDLSGRYEYLKKSRAHIDNDPKPEPPEFPEAENISEESKKFAIARYKHSLKIWKQRQ